MKPMAEALARQGRGPDSMLMHVAPAEVAGIAALTGQQPTINPVTGQPEGFVFLAPLLGAVGGAMGLGPLGTAALTGVGTAAITGDLKRGLVAGLTSGLASELGEGLSDVLSDGAGDVAEGVAESLTDGATDVAAQAGVGVNTAVEQAAQSDLVKTGIGGFDKLNQAVAGKLGEMSTTGQLLGTAMGSGQLAQMDYEDMLRQQGRAFEDEREAKRAQAYMDLKRAQLAAQPSLSSGFSGSQAPMSYNLPRRGMQEGGTTTTQPTAPTSLQQAILDRAARQTALSPEDQRVLESYYSQYSADRPADVVPDINVPDYGPNFSVGPYSDEDFMDIRNRGPRGRFGRFIDDDVTQDFSIADEFGAGSRAVSVQQGLRGRNVVAPPRDYRPGFEPEFSYYQADPDYIAVPDRSYRPVTQGIQSTGSYFEDVTKKQEGGSIELRTPFGQEEVSSGGIANVPTSMRADMPTKEEVLMVASALTGQTERANEIIEMFVAKYGSDAFRMIRDMVLKAGNPDAQTEGLIRGEGSGMDDLVSGTIGRSDPVAVSPGEFIVPADVVSGLGDGSTDAGSQELYNMMDRVRMGRGGTTKQAPAINAEAMLPA